MDPVFGWGSECRFSWGTAKEMMEKKGAAARADWPDAAEEPGDNMKLTGFMMGGKEDERDELGNWYGRKVTEEVF